MSIFKEFQAWLNSQLEAMMRQGALPAGLDLGRVTVEPPRDPSHGEMSTNAAMVLAKAAGQPPRKLAEALVARLASRSDVSDVAIAGPGFVNWRLDPELWRRQVALILQAGPRYGDSTMGRGEKVNVEYVSANPTGPLHVGHARGAVFGDALAELLHKAGFAVTKEYYINDAGAQVDTLARSAYLRYREALGEAIGEIPEGLYPGEYLKDVGPGAGRARRRKWVEAAEADWLPAVRAFAIDLMMDEVRERPGGARHPPGRLHFGARAGRGRRRRRGGDAPCRRAG